MVVGRSNEPSSAADARLKKTHPISSAGKGAWIKIVYSGVPGFESLDRCRGDVFPFGGSGCRRTSVRPPAAADP